METPVTADRSSIETGFSGSSVHCPRHREVPADPSAPSFRLIVCLLLFFPSMLSAQGSAGSGAKLEPRFIVDMPTAGMLDAEAIAADIEFYQDGGLLLGVSYGVFNWFSIGVSYGGTNLIGGESPDMNPVPGVDVRFRIIDENVALPAIVLGFNTQGRDGYVDETDRYVFKSPGVFVCLSKNYLMLGFLSLHAGANYSLERADGDENVNVYAGAEKTITSFLSVAGEYNLALNDNSSGGKGRGYLNVSLRCTLGGGLTMAFAFKDLLHNSRELTMTSRTAYFEFVHGF